MHPLFVQEDEKTSSATAPLARAPHRAIIHGRYEGSERRLSAGLGSQADHLRDLEEGHVHGRPGAQQGGQQAARPHHEEAHSVLLDEAGTSAATAGKVRTTLPWPISPAPLPVWIVGLLSLRH